MSFFNEWIYNCFSNVFVRWQGLELLDTGKIADGIYAVKTGMVNFYVYTKDSVSIALDAGFGVPVIKRELNALGFNPAQISAVFLSHSDFDHVGGVTLFHNAAVYLSHDEEQMIKRKTAREFGFAYTAKINRTYHLLKDNDVITIGPIRVRAIETPGHTPGSMCYLIDDCVLFTGDAFRILNGKVQPIGRIMNMDQQMHVQSIRKMAKLEGVKQILTGHRGYNNAFDDAMEHWK